MFTKYKIVNIAIPGAGFINETSIINQLYYASNYLNTNNFHYDAVILIKCGIFNKFADQDFYILENITNIAKKCIKN